MHIDAALEELGRILYGLNYVVSLTLYRVPPFPGASATEYVASAFCPGVVVGGSGPVSGPEMLAEVETSLRYAGDTGSGPRPAMLRSKRYEELLRIVLAHFSEASAAATVIERFWFREGHPHYPVFWDFAFVIAGPHGAEVFVGSSSD